MSEWPRMRHSCVQVSEASARAFWRFTSIAGRAEKDKKLSKDLKTDVCRESRETKQF